MLEWMLDTFRYSIIVMTFILVFGVAAGTISLIIAIFAAAWWFALIVPFGVSLTAVAVIGAIKLVNAWTETGW